MKLLILTLSLFAVACSSTPVQPQRGFELPPALSEVYRGGTLTPMQQADSPVLGMPNQYDRVEHVCTSGPIYDVYGRYVRTDVRCW